MNPIAFNLFGINVHWYGIILSSATVTGIVLALKEADRKGLDSNLILDLVIWMVPVAIICARSYYVIFNWDFYKDNPREIIAIWHGGIAIHGAIFGGSIAVYFYSKFKKLSMLQLLDILAPGLVLGQAIGRWGNFINQEAYGYETNLPWAMYIDGAYRHPTFLYESIWDFMVFLTLQVFKKRKENMNGDVFFLYATLYSVGRFFIEGFRTDSLMLGNFRVAQIVSLAVIILGMLFMHFRRRKRKALKKSFEDYKNRHAKDF